VVAGSRSAPPRTAGARAKTSADVAKRREDIRNAQSRAISFKRVDQRPRDAWHGSGQPVPGELIAPFGDKLGA